MLGDIVELSVVVRDLDAAIERYTTLFGLKLHHRGESKEFGFKNAIPPTSRSRRWRASSAFPRGSSSTG